MREPGNHDNGANDVWALTAYYTLINVSVTYDYGGAVVYWIEPLTLDQRVAGLILVNAWHFCPSARHFIHTTALHPGI